MALALGLLPGCGGPDAHKGEKKVVENPDLGFRIVLPWGWLFFFDEIRSPAGSVLSIQVSSLEGAERKFLAGLPESVVPQLDQKVKYFFSVVDPPTKSRTALGGEPALEVTYRARMRDTDSPSQVTYWVCRRGDLLYVLRCAYPPGQAEKEEPQVREILSSFTFLTPAPS